jgi:hypothetical protein
MQHLVSDLPNLPKRFASYCGHLGVHDRRCLARDPLGKLALKSAKRAAWIGVGLWTGVTFVGLFTPIRELAASVRSGWGPSRRTSRAGDPAGRVACVVLPRVKKRWKCAERLKCGILCNRGVADNPKLQTPVTSRFR